jgi:diacylglycerol kinase family enzyme
MESFMRTSVTTPNQNYAVVLNANAGRVTKNLTTHLQTIIPEERLHLTNSLLHSRDVIRQCIETGCETIFAGGGDGTIVDALNTVNDFKHLTDRTPTIGALRLGTGNALAHWLGSATPAEDLNRWRSGRSHKILHTPMVKAEDTLFPFAGLGLDAAILNDYNRVKQQAKNTWKEPFIKGMSGYTLAGYTKTLPEYFSRPKNRVRIINVGRPAFKIGPNGNEIGEPIATGDTLYEGECTVVACASMPFYGYKMKMFPFATQRHGRFQLRVVTMSPMQIALNIFSCWNGNIRHPQLLDYYADRVRVVFEDTMPYQLGGEASGYRKEITFSLSSNPTPMLSHA